MKNRDKIHFWFDLLFIGNHYMLLVLLEVPLSGVFFHFKKTYFIQN